MDLFCDCGGPLHSAFRSLLTSLGFVILRPLLRALPSNVTIWNYCIMSLCVCISPDSQILAVVDNLAQG